jgi:hypothetical protein
VIQSVADVTINNSLICVVTLQSGRMLSQYLESNLKLGSSGFFDTQVNFNKSARCYVLLAVVFALRNQRGMKRIMFSSSHESLYSPYCSGNISGKLVVLEAYSTQLMRGVALNRLR